MRAAILQSNYLPWKGYFDIVHDVDLFIFLDDVQYTHRDWRNRNRIKTNSGTKWLTVPVGSGTDRLICEVDLPGDDWAKSHWDRLSASYGTSPHFALYRPFLEELYGNMGFTTLSELNQHLIRHISTEFLGIQTAFRNSGEFGVESIKQERIIDLLKLTGASTYVSGPAAKDYLDEDRLFEEGIRLVWKDYSGYPEYDQPHPPFRHDVTILDLLFCVGPKSPEYIWGRGKEGRDPA
jgi:hypothetical protein